MQKISLIPYSCGAGAGDDDCASGPEALKKWDLVKALHAHDIESAWVEGLAEDKNPANNTEIVTKHCIDIRDKVKEVLQAGGFPVTIGGDHSMAIGTWTGVADSLHSRRKLGLIWVDAHMDAHTAQTSPSGNRHGMPISYLLGLGDDALADITGRSPVIVPHQLCLVGVRSFEKGEAALLKKLGARVFMMDEVRERGLDVVMLEAAKIASAHTAGFGISVDVDAFDPTIAPGTGTTEKHGLMRREFIQVARNTLSGYKESLLALEIAEYNPHKDKGHITAKLIADIISSILGGSRISS